MARQKQMKVGALNIVTHTHTTLKYAQLFAAAYATEKAVKIRGNDWGLLASMYPSKVEDQQVPEVFKGTIFRFLNIEPGEPWLNLKTHKAVKPNETPDIPDYLRPNLRTSNFVFFPKGHRLFFDALKLTPNCAQVLFAALFKQELIVKEFGPVSIHIETDRQEFEQLLAIANKQKIHLDITLPNPDDPGEDEADVIERLEKQNIRRKISDLTALTHDGIRPDEELKAEMKAARSNGMLTISGRDEANKRVERSTKLFPLLKLERYDPEQVSPVEKIFDIGRRLIAGFRAGD